MTLDDDAEFSLNQKSVPADVCVCVCAPVERHQSSAFVGCLTSGDEQQLGFDLKLTLIPAQRTERLEMAEQHKTTALKFTTT